MLLRSAVLLLVISTALAYKSTDPAKTKKYKCFEVADDEEVRIVPKKKHSSYERAWRQEDEELRPIGSARFGAAAPAGNEVEDTMDAPLAKKMPDVEIIAPVTEAIPVATTPSAADIEASVQHDSQGRPLILSPEHCEKVKHYSAMYGVKDARPWVERNCEFAKMFVPDATCSEINILVASCYKL